MKRKITINYFLSLIPIFQDRKKHKYKKCVDIKRKTF